MFGWNLYTFSHRLEIISRLLRKPKRGWEDGSVCGLSQKHEDLNSVLRTPSLEVEREAEERAQKLRACDALHRGPGFASKCLVARHHL